MAFLAKRSIEMRLGVHLSDLKDDLPLVEAPAKWESTVCATTGIDYTKLQQGTFNELMAHSDPYIGDYVTKLQGVVESYRLVNNFHEGDDTAVISIRDDVQNVRATCDTSGKNLCYESGAFDHGPGTNTPGWTAEGCASSARGAVVAPNDFTDSAWEKNSVVVTPDATTAPDGSTTADKIADISGTGEFEVKQVPQGATADSAGAITVSMYAKAGTITELGLTTLEGNYAFFDLENGTAGGDAPQVTITPAGSGGWYLCSMTYFGTGLEVWWSLAKENDRSYVGDGTGYLYLWGASWTLAPLPDCVAAQSSFPGSESGNGLPTLPDDAVELAPVQWYQLQFGNAAAGTNCDPATCSYRAGAAWVQRVHLDPGTYVASVYSRDDWVEDAGLRIQGIDAPVQAQTPSWITDREPFRQYVVFKVTQPETVAMRFEKPVIGDHADTSSVVVAAPMIENVDGTRLANFLTGNPDLPPLLPTAFVSTTDKLTRPLPTCEDTDGKQFRLHGWRHGSDLLCPDGFSGNCRGDNAKSFGYWQTTFNINQRDIEAGRILTNAGFARGNFNYRIDSLALNFVGTGLKKCGDTALPTTCYSGAFVPYTLIHDGPYYVTNYQGGTFTADLFTGRIENARGLAAERYVTNPISSADQTLLGDYFRKELQGRPMDGNFTLRVWDTPGLDFNAIQDVQVILKYHYWTRFE